MMLCSLAICILVNSNAGWWVEEINAERSAEGVSGTEKKETHTNNWVNVHGRRRNTHSEASERSIGYRLYTGERMGLSNAAALWDWPVQMSVTFSPLNMIWSLSEDIFPQQWHGCDELKAVLLRSMTWELFFRHMENPLEQVYWTQMKQ